MERKINNVVIKDLEGGCSEISRRTASSKDEVKHIACLVSGRGLGKSEVKVWNKKARTLLKPPIHRFTDNVPIRNRSLSGPTI